MSLLELRQVLNQTVQLQYIKGHAGHEGNEGADRQANLGATEPEIPDEPDWDAKRELVEARIAAIEGGQVEAPILVYYPNYVWQ